MTSETLLGIPPSKMSIDRVKKNFLTGYQSQSKYQGRHYWDAMRIINAYEEKSRDLKEGDLAEAQRVDNHDVIIGGFLMFDQSVDVQRCYIEVNDITHECYGDSLKKIIIKK